MFERSCVGGDGSDSQESKKPPSGEIQNRSGAADAMPSFDSVLQAASGGAA